MPRPAASATRSAKAPEPGTHDHDAVRIGGQRLAEVVEHLLGQPAGILLDQIGDAERLGRGARAVGARQGRPVAGLPPICM